MLLIIFMRVFIRPMHFNGAKINSSRTGRGQMLEVEAETQDKFLWPRPWPRTKFWHRGLNTTAVHKNKLWLN